MFGVIMLFDISLLANLILICYVLWWIVKDLRCLE